jgi:hypothetical protein
MIGGNQQSANDRQLARKPTLQPRRINKSEKNPEHSTPTNAARNGSDASKPD